MAEFPGIEGGLLTIDLAALVENYRLLQGQCSASRVAAVVKADAYGLGASKVVPVLAQAGCVDFFVAHLAEALAIKPLVPGNGRIYVLNGVSPGAEGVCADHGMIPVLNSMEQAARWRALAANRDAPLPAVLQVDSGMSRLGLMPQDAARIAGDDDFLAHVPLLAVMSHMACADEPAHPDNDRQLACFKNLAALFPGTALSLSNSGACFLPAAFHGDIARPGVALYGAAPVDGLPNPMRPVVRLSVRVIQTREIGAGAGVGYGMSWRAPEPRRLATLCVGYADGWPRILSNKGSAWFDGVRLPIAGRVSMDSTVVDISALPAGRLREGDLVELIGPHQTLEDVARDAGTISYEILTSLGRRYARQYIPADQSVPLAETLS